MTKISKLILGNFHFTIIDRPTFFSKIANNKIIVKLRKRTRKDHLQVQMLQKFSQVEKIHFLKQFMHIVAKLIFAYISNESEQRHRKITKRGEWFN